MKYLAKKKVFDNIKKTYKANKIIEEELGFTQSYVSQVLNATRTVPKNTAFSITKCINLNAKISDFFEIVR